MHSLLLLKESKDTQNGEGTTRGRGQAGVTLLSLLHGPCSREGHLSDYQATAFSDFKVQEWKIRPSGLINKSKIGLLLYRDKLLHGMK